MLGVLLVLLVGSLGFAQYLVAMQQRKPHLVVLLDHLLATAEKPMMEDEVAARSGMISGHPRYVHVFAWDAPRNMNTQQQINEAAGIFEGIAEQNPDERGVGSIDGQLGIQMSGKSAAGHFTMLRLAVIQSQAVAISYSGPAPYTDADRTTFDALCSTGIQFQK